MIPFAATHSLSRWLFGTSVTPNPAGWRFSFHFLFPSVRRVFGQKKTHSVENSQGTQRSQLIKTRELASSSSRKPTTGDLRPESVNLEREDAHYITTLLLLHCEIRLGDRGDDDQVISCYLDQKTSLVVWRFPLVPHRSDLWSSAQCRCQTWTLYSPEGRCSLLADPDSSDRLIAFIMLSFNRHPCRSSSKSCCMPCRISRRFTCWCDQRRESRRPRDGPPFRRWFPIFESNPKCQFRVCCSTECVPSALIPLRRSSPSRETLRLMIWDCRRRI